MLDLDIPAFAENPVVIVIVIVIVVLLLVAFLPWSKIKKVRISKGSIRLEFFRSKSEKVRRRQEEDISKGDDVRPPPSDTAPTGDRPQGLEGGRTPEKREERRDEAPEPAPDSADKLRRWWIAKAAVGLALSLVFAGGVYFGWVQWEKRLVEDKVKIAVALAGEMVEIPGGMFPMGNLNCEEDPNERPVHAVTVPSFWMGKHEVTLSQWNACADAGNCTKYDLPKGQDQNPGGHPVTNVSWDNAQAFIAWLNEETGSSYRLPTESEWEYAARAGSESLYSWGDVIEVNRANCLSQQCGDKWSGTAEVGSFPVNAWGLHDMHGNVWEWVGDCVNENYRGAPSDGSAWESGDCGQRVVRGGSWGSPPRNLRSSNRDWTNRSYRSGYLGFRLARDG